MCCLQQQDSTAGGTAGCGFGPGSGSGEAALTELSGVVDALASVLPHHHRAALTSAACRAGHASGGQDPMWVRARDGCLTWGLQILHDGLPDPAAAPAVGRAPFGKVAQAPLSLLLQQPPEQQPLQQLRAARGAPGPWPEQGPGPASSSSGGGAGRLALRFLKRSFPAMLEQCSLGVADAAFKVWVGSGG